MKKKKLALNTSAPWFVPTGMVLGVREGFLQTLRAVDGRVPMDVRAELDDMGGTPVDDDGEWSGEGGVALINGVGPIAQYDDFFNWYFGGCALEVFMSQMEAAAANPDVRAIVTVLDSPGGEVAGIADAADRIRAIGELKPVIAWVPGESCSATYWLAAGAQSIVLSQTGILGSVGIKITTRDTSKADEKAGIEQLEFISNVSPDKAMDPATDSGKAQLQAIVNEYGDLMVAAVAKLRGVSVDKVLSDYGQGGVLIGAKAVAAGLGDQIGTLDSAIALALQLADAKAKASNSGSAKNPVPAMPFEGSGKSSTRVTASAGADAPGGMPEMDEQAIRAEAAQAERQRVAAIRKLDTPANRAVCGKEIDAAYEGTMTAPELAMTILSARDNKDRAFAKARAQDGAEVAVDDLPEDPNYTEPTGEEVAAMRKRGEQAAAGVRKPTAVRKPNVAAAAADALARLNGQKRLPARDHSLGEEG